MLTDPENNTDDSATSGETSNTAVPQSYPLGLEGELANIPASKEDSYDWSNYGEYADSVMSLYQAVGGRVARINIVQTHGPSMPDFLQYGFDALDTLVAAYQARGTRLAMTVSYQRALSGGAGADISQPWIWTNDTEKNQYRDYLIDMLERYDGDGQNDAPGLQYPVKVWQIHNELEAQWRSAMDMGVQTWATPEDYAELLQYSASVIREKMPDAIIVASHYPWPGSDSADFNGDGVSERYMNRVKELGGYDNIDVVEIHDFTGSLSHLKAGLEYAAEASGLPVWAGQVLAANAPTSNEPAATTSTQAEKVVKLLAGALAVGAKQVHWWGLINADEGAVSQGGITPVFAYSGLYAACNTSSGIGSICSDPELLPAGANFKKLADMFEGYSSSSVIQPLSLEVVSGQADSSRLVLRIERENQSPFVIAWDDADGNLDTSSLFEGAQTIEVIHFVTSGTELSTETVPVGNLSLSSVPVLLLPGSG